MKIKIGFASGQSIELIDGPLEYLDKLKKFFLDDQGPYFEDKYIMFDSRKVEFIYLVPEEKDFKQPEVEKLAPEVETLETVQ